MRDWIRLCIIYNLALLVALGVMLYRAYFVPFDGIDGGIILAPESSVSGVATDSAFALVALNVLFLLCGPGLARLINSAIGFERQVRIGLFALLLLAGVACFVGYLSLVLSPF